MANTPENAALVKAVLNSLHGLYSTQTQDATLSIDTRVSNPARLWKLYGTHARKGDHTAERPHRQASIISVPNEIVPVPVEVLTEFIRRAEAKPNREGKPRPVQTRSGGGLFDLAAYLEHTSEDRQDKGRSRGTLYCLEHCILPNRTDGPNEAGIFQASSGAVSYQCFHDSCKGPLWADARQKISGSDKLSSFCNFPEKPGAGCRTGGRHLGDSNGAGQQTGPVRPGGFTAAGLIRTDFPEPRFLVPELIAEGLSILAGKPKFGKSWLVLGLGIAVACGGKLFGQIALEPGEVLYLALEDGPRRLKKRILSILCGGPAPENLHFFTQWPRMDEGGLKLLDDWMNEKPHTRLVVIDTLAKLWPRALSRNGNETLYTRDYDVISNLKAIADLHNISIVGVHHLRKAVAEDPLEQISGSMGISGAADSLMVLQKVRGQADATLLCCGRDIEERTLALRFDSSITNWALLGEAEPYRRGREQSALLKIIRQQSGPVSVTDLIEISGKQKNNLMKMLAKLEHVGLISYVLAAD